MEDNDLDKTLASYTVADADKALLNRIVAAATTENVVTTPVQPANENSSALWFRRSAMLAATAVLGFWLGNATIPSQSADVSATTMTTSTGASAAETPDYLDNMIIGSGSLTDMRL